MKKPILIILLSMAFVSQTLAQEDCRKALQRYMKTYPASDLCDVYKFCFQDVFGPEHLTLDSAKAAAYLQGELEKYSTLGGPDYEPTGCKGNYVRVNLRLVRQGKITAEHLLDCLLRSAQGNTPVDLDEWRYRWSEIETLLSAMEPRPNHFALDSDSIEKLLARGGYVVHHSYPYNSTYNFHYRLIRRDIFEQEILPKIEN